jgi:hypothetical protein
MASESSAVLEYGVPEPSETASLMADKLRFHNKPPRQRGVSARQVSGAGSELACAEIRHECRSLAGPTIQGRGPGMALNRCSPEKEKGRALACCRGFGYDALPIHFCNSASGTLRPCSGRI